MTLPENVVAVRCDVDTAWKLHKELLEAGVPCVFKRESSFRASYKITSDIGLVWCGARFIISLPNHNSATEVSMPEFRAAFNLPIKPKP